MKKILVHLLLIVVLIQVIPGSKLLAQTKNNNTLESYYTTINHAEIAVVRENYKLATEHYSQAFRQYGGIRFAKDLMNAFYAALFAGDTILSVYYLDSLAFYGFHTGRPIKYFENKPIQSSLSKRCDSIQSVGKASLDWVMIKACDSFLQVDQAIRKQYGNDKSEAGIRAFKRLDSLNFYGFLDHVDKYGFPAFNKIGFLSMNSAAPIQTNIFYLLLWHQRSTIFPDSVEHKIRDLIYQGYLLPYDYATCRFARYDHYGFIPTAALPVAEVERINGNRKEIYMETVAEFKEKMGKKFKIEGISATSQIPFVFHNMFTAPSYESR